MDEISRTFTHLTFFAYGLVWLRQVPSRSCRHTDDLDLGDGAEWLKGQIHLYRLGNRCCLMGIQFHFCKMKRILEVDGGVCMIM